MRILTLCRIVTALPLLACAVACTANVGTPHTTGKPGANGGPDGTTATGTGASSSVDVTTPGAGGAGNSGPILPTQATLPPADLPPALAAPVELPMRRLSAAQYQEVLKEIVRRALPTDGATVANAVPDIVEASLYPEDILANLDGGRHGGLLRTDQALQQAHVDGSYTAAQKLGVELTNSPARITDLVGTCATDADASNDDACLTSFVQRFGQLALRRSLDAGDVDFYKSIAGTTPVAPGSIANVVALLLTSPDLMHSIELGSGMAAPGRITLTAHELAARLALHFWNSIPNAELQALADSGDILKPDAFKAQVAKMALDPRANATAIEFFAQWFRMKEVPELNSRLTDPVFKAIVGDFTPTSQTRQDALAEIDGLVSFTYQNNGTLSGLANDNHAYSRSPELASLYGVPAWDGVSAPGIMPSRNLLTRVAFTASGLANTRPILKGMRIINGLLCQSLPPPPPAAMGVVIELSPDSTTREVVDGLTSPPSCAGCHRLINPYGFITENFDPIGRERSTQQLYDVQGNPTVAKPVATDAAIQIAGQTHMVSGATEALKYILESGQIEGCFAQQYFRFAFGRKEFEFDRYIIEQLNYFARTNANLGDVMQQVALRPEFQLRMAQ